ncbi:MAG TPA: hypothetical protein VG939_19370 [Caulobacteraceae bacterium]|nr:hypothetical protein [Caulobacteraceae bacterium]
MTQVAIGAAIGEGFALVRRQPLAVLAWGVLQMLLTAVVWWFYMPIYLGSLRISLPPAGGGRPPLDPAALQHLMQMEGYSILVGLVSMATQMVVYAAVFRAVLHPEQSRFGYLRLGMSELYLCVLAVGAYFAFSIGLAVVMIPIFIVVAILAAVHAVAAAVVFAVIAVVAVFLGLIYLALRYSMVGPMIVADGQFHFAESWRLTRGRVLPLLGLAVVLFLMLLAAEAVIFGVLLLVGGGALMATVGGLDHLRDFLLGPPAAVLGRLAPFLVVFAVVWAPFVGVIYALFGAPWARVYRDLSQGDISTTFA